MSSDVSSIYSQENINSPNSASACIYEFENFRLDAAHLMLYENEQPITLAPKVVETLVALVEKRGEVISKDELMRRLWRDSFVEESNLTQNIYLLRKTLGNGSAGNPLIETFRRRGYRFTGEIKNLSAVRPVSGREGAGDSISAAPLPQPSAGDRDEPVFDSLAVLPLTTETKDETAEYLSDGITESIINRLSQLKGFHVVARNTAFRYKNREIEPCSVGSDLGVKAVLTGRVLQFSDRLIVRTELTDTATGWQIWGEQFDCLPADVLELQESIARGISEKLHLKLSGEEQRNLSKRDTQSSEAYRFYVKGRYFLHQRLTPTIEQATGYFQQAIDTDPAYALAYVGLADCYPLLSLYGALTPDEAYPKARAAALRALEIDDHLAAAYNSLGVVKLFYEWDWRGAEECFRQAIQINPGYADAHQRYGLLLTAAERFDEAAVEFERACELDPLSLITKTLSGCPFYYSRRFEEAAERFAAVIAADENYSMAHFRLGLTYAQLDRYADAIAELEKSRVLSDDRDVVAALGCVHGMQGDSPKARAALEELSEREKKGFVSAYDRAIVYAGMRDAEAALDWLEKAYEERSYWLIYLKSDPVLDPLRCETRFKDLEARIFGAKILTDPGGRRDFRAEDRANAFLPGSRSVAAVLSNFYSLGGAAVVLVLAVVFGVFYGLPGGRNGEGRDTNGPASIVFKRLTPDVNAINPAISPDGKYLVYVRQEDNARSLWLRELATGSLRQVMPAAAEGYEMPLFSPDSKEIYYASKRKNVPNSIILRVSITGGAPQEVAANVTSPFTVSPDNRRVAFIRDQQLVLANTDGGGEQILAERDVKTAWFESWGSQMSWSPDGSTIVVCGGRTENNKSRFELTEISVADGRERSIAVPDWDYLDDVQWIPDRSGLIVIARETSGSPFQLWRIDYATGEIARLTRDFQDYHSITLTADSKFLVAEQEIGNRNLWTVSLTDAKQIKQLTFGTAANDGYQGMTTLPDGRIVYTSPRSGNLDLWIMDPDGANQRQLTADAGLNAWPDSSPDGRYVVFTSTRSGARHLWRIDPDGANAIQLTHGAGLWQRPIVAPDGKWVYFTRHDGPRSLIWKVPIEGGDPIRVSPHDNVGLYSASPDGKLLAFQQYDKESPNPWRVGVMRADTGEVLQLLDQAMWGQIGWSAGSDALVYIEASSNRNLWQQPLNGGAPRQITSFDAGQLRTFDVSPDYKTLVLSRGHALTEAVMISNFR